MKTTFTLILALFISFSIYATEGESCDDPITANMGENSATVENGDQWFKFTAATAGDYIISNNEYISSSDMVWLKVYSDCNTELDTLYDMGGSGSTKMVSLDANESILLMWKQDYSHIAFTFNIYTAENGDAFDKPIVVSAPNTITFPANKDVLYYSYTVSEASILILSENNNDYNATLYKTNGDEIYSDGIGERKYDLKPGTYIIKMKSYVDVSFDWTLTKREINLGEYCYAPIVLTESGKVDFGGNEDFVYYSFTAQDDGKISGSNMLASYMVIYNECNGTEIYTADITSEFFYAVEKDENYIIKLSTGYGVDEFEWDFIVADGTGESCNKPIIIDAYGTISTPVNNGLLYYKYTCTNTGAFRISDGEDNVDNNVALYANCDEAANGFNHELAIGEDGEILYQAEANQEFIIVWDIGINGQTSNNMLEWSIIADNTPGLSCNNPIILNQPGDVQYEAGNPELYYSYTASRDCRLELSHDDSFTGDFVMYLDCDGDQFDQNSYNGEMVIYAEEGVNYIFKWKSSYSPYNTFTWTINEVDYLGGEVCKYPQVISEPGDIDFTQTRGEWYYSYTATIEGALKVSDGDNRSLVEIYSDCDELNGWDYSNMGELTTSGNYGKTYIIKWTNYAASAFSWTLTESTGVTGETCNNPIVIESLGEQGTPVEFEVPETTAYTYYSFTPDIDQMLIVTDGNHSHGVAIDSTCDFNTASYSNSGELSTELIANTTYIMRWSTQNGTSYTWTADSRDLLPGETPNSAIIIPESGNVEYLNDRADLYYKYTATKDAAIEMTSDNANAYVNNGSLKYVLAGETVLIHWVNPNKTTFTWTLTERDIIVGETCSHPIEITNTGDMVCDLALSQVYYSYTPSQNSTIALSEASESHYVIVTKGCNVSEFYSNSNGVIAFEAKTSDTFIISWNKSESNDFTWNIIEETPQIGETAANPMVIEQPKTVDFMGIDKGLVRNYYSYTPTVNQQINLSDVNFAMVWDAATGDTISEVYYDVTEFVANKNSTYIIVWELYGGNIDTLTLSATELYEETNTVTFNVSDDNSGIADAMIAINGVTITTDVSGIATIQLEDGNYNYTVTVNNYESYTAEVMVSGSAITAKIVLKTAGIMDKSQATLNIYPNPTQGDIIIKSSKQIEQVSLFTIDGKEILLENESNNFLNIEHLKSGIYLLQINTNGNIITKRIIKK